VGPEFLHGLVVLDDRGDDSAGNAEVVQVNNFVRGKAEYFLRIGDVSQQDALVNASLGHPGDFPCGRMR
jgi:hypothetical protein